MRLTEMFFAIRASPVMTNQSRPLDLAEIRTLRVSRTSKKQTEKNLENICDLAKMLNHIGNNNEVKTEGDGQRLKAYSARYCEILSENEICHTICERT